MVETRQGHCAGLLARLFVILVFTTWAPTAISAAETFIPGKIIVVKSGKLVKMTSKVSGLTLPSGADDPTVAGATLRIFDTGGSAGDITFNLEPAGWSALGSPAGSKGFKYSGGACKIVIVKPKLIKALCTGTSLATPYAGAAGVILTAGGDTTYCAEFGGTEKRNDTKLTKRKDAAAPLQCPVVEIPTGTPTGTAAATATPTGTPLPGCPLQAGKYTYTNLPGGTLQVGAIGAPNGFAFPSGGTVVQDIAAASLPGCVHDAIVPASGGFAAPPFCLGPGTLNFTVEVKQAGCGVGQIDSNGGSDYTVTEVADTSDSAVCTSPSLHQTCTNGQDNGQRVDITVGNGMVDACADGGTVNAIVAIPVTTTTWQRADFACPDPDGMYNPGTDALILQVPQVLDFTTDVATASWADLDGDGCGKVPVGDASATTLSRTGTCANLGAMTVTTAAAGTVASSAGPLYDLTFATRLPNSISGPATLSGDTCASPPPINFAGLAHRCIGP